MGKPDPLITPHEIYLHLGNDLIVRCFHYRELFRVNLSAYDVHCIRECLAANQVLGQSRFKEQVEMALSRRLGYLKRGRPASNIAADQNKLLRPLYPPLSRQGMCLTACAVTGGRMVTIGSARNAGQYAHELFHMMGFRHEGFPQSIMYGSFAESKFRVNGVHAYHIDKLNSVYMQ